MPKVSIIIPVYNVEAYLTRCLESVIKQTFQDFEVICIDDCSPDQSREILRQYEKNYPDKVRVLVNEENFGQGKSRERGIEAAQGEYLMFIDADDYIDEEYIQMYYSGMQESDADVVIGGYTRDMAGNLKEHRIPDSRWSLVTFPVVWAKMYKKSFVQENKMGFSKVRFAEDIYFNLAVLYHQARYHVIPYTRYYYYFNAESTTGTMTYDRNQEGFIAELFGTFLETHDLSLVSEETTKMIEYTYIANMINGLITYGHGCGVKRMRQKIDFWMQDMNEKFPDYKKNPYVGILKPKGQTMKIRLGVGVIMTLKKLHLDRPLFYLLSLV